MKKEIFKIDNISEEIGKFFQANGLFKEDDFRNFLSKKFLELKKETKSEEEFQISINKWMTSYLADLIDYLKKKELSDAAFSLFKAAVDEATKIGLDRVVLSTDNLAHIFSITTSINHEEKEEKKNSPDQKKKLIFDAALVVFAKKGYHKSTIDEIAKISGVAKGSVYRYFKSKNDLLSQLLKEKYNEIFTPISKIFSKDADVLDQIQEMIELWIDFIENNHIVYRLIQNEAIAKTIGEQNMFYDYFINQLPMFKERILALNREKKLKTTNFYSVFYGILGFIDGIVHKWFRRGMDYSLKSEIPLILEVLFNGFVGEKNTRKSFFDGN